MQYAHKMKSHRPKGALCMICVHKLKDCSGMEFEKMPVIGKDQDGIVVVNCVEYKFELTPIASLPALTKNTKHGKD